MDEDREALKLEARKLVNTIRGSPRTPLSLSATVTTTPPALPPSSYPATPAEHATAPEQIEAQAGCHNALEQLPNDPSQTSPRSEAAACEPLDISAVRAFSPPKCGSLLDAMYAAKRAPIVLSAPLRHKPRTQGKQRTDQHRVHRAARMSGSPYRSGAAPQVTRSPHRRARSRLAGDVAISVQHRSQQNQDNKLEHGQEEAGEMERKLKGLMNVEWAGRVLLESWGEEEEEEGRSGEEQKQDKKDKKKNETSECSDGNCSAPGSEGCDDFPAPAYEQQTLSWEVVDDVEVSAYDQVKVFSKEARSSPTEGRQEAKDTETGHGYINRVPCTKN
eukprot:TRINITY_DN3548_c0_g5_i1.p1 TRINITY_DN3548_c0_g5~~TRINITY_DN3548_c0_g5_i1.p1  ORF type:complete len:332 (-),score=72.64 TRINITY_DN3548_c0_g5_i1:77-1072(-)